jgi:hypothetical protein
VLYWSSGDGGRLLAALARGRNRFGGGGRGTTKDEAAEEDEEQAAAVVIIGAGDDEEYASDKLSGFKGLVLDLSYRCDHKHFRLVWLSTQKNNNCSAAFFARWIKVICLLMWHATSKWRRMRTTMTHRMMRNLSSGLMCRLSEVRGILSG